jgi:hypothetical protein
VVRTIQGEHQARKTRERQVETMRAQWEKALWPLSNHCEPDAQAALARQLTQRPPWLTVQAHLLPHPKQHRPGRPRQGTPPDRTEWQIQATVSVDADALTQAILHTASFLVAMDTDQLPDQDRIRTDKDQHHVERGFRFLNDPLFLASSVFVKKPERIVALSLVMVLCLLVYRLAEHRLREHLAATSQTVPNHLKQPTDRPTMRWIFPCFAGVSLVPFPSSQGPPHGEVANLEPLHEQVGDLLGLECQKFYKAPD